MRYFLALLASVLLVSCASLPRPQSAGEISGLWQFPDIQVWIQISSDGSAFQCRVAQDDELIVSKGRFDNAGSIVWEQHWGTDRVYIVPGSIVLRGIYGKFTYITATSPLSDGCANALAAA
jgi:outer membrane biogenesis lipoprotein LolB